MQPDRTINYYLQGALRRLDHGDFADELRVETVYRQLAGDLISRLTMSVQVSKGVLSLRMASAALRSELMRRREGLRVKINDHFGAEVVKTIYIR